jgi:uncharacterized protein involved in exopolysaccharide biosynthesis
MNTSDRKYIRWLVLRQLPMAAGVFMLLSSIVIVGVTFLKVPMTATAFLMEEAPSLAQNTVPSADFTAGPAHLQRIENRVTTQANLAAALDAIGAQIPVETFRNAISIDTAAGRDRATTMSISVTDPDAEFATDAANQLAQMVLSENDSIARERTTEALQFFRREVTSSKARLDKEFDALLRFKQAKAGVLPEDSARYLDLRKILIHRETIRGPSSLSDTTRERLTTELGAARGLFADTHPTVRALTSRLNNVVPTPAEENAPLAELTDVASQLARIDDRLAEIPANSLALSALERDHALAEAQYTAAVSRLDAAAAEARRAARENGSRLTIVERASPPSLPEGPRQKIALAGGLALAFLIALGTAILRGRSDPFIRRPRDIEASLSIRPYAVIPNMRPA